MGDGSRYLIPLPTKMPTQREKLVAEDDNGNIRDPIPNVVASQ